MQTVRILLFIMHTVWIFEMYAVVPLRPHQEATDGCVEVMNVDGEHGDKQNNR